MHSESADLARRSESPLSTLTSQFVGSFTTDQVVGSFTSIWGQLSASLDPYHVDDWDGDGASAIAPYAVGELKKFIGVLPPNTVVPEVSAGYDGSIGLAWHEPELSMVVHIPPTGMLDFTFDLSRHALRYSKKLAAGDPTLINEIRPTLAYISTVGVTFMLANITISLTYYPMQMSQARPVNVIGE
jgi:hypothetical protein